MSKSELLNKIFTEHLLELLAVYNRTGQRLAEIEENYDRTINHK